MGTADSGLDGFCASTLIGALWDEGESSPSAAVGFIVHGNFC